MDDIGLKDRTNCKQVVAKLRFFSIGITSLIYEVFILYIRFIYESMIDV